MMTIQASGVRRQTPREFTMYTFEDRRGALVLVEVAICAAGPRPDAPPPKRPPESWQTPKSPDNPTTATAYPWMNFDTKQFERMMTGMERKGFRF